MVLILLSSSGYIDGQNANADSGRVMLTSTTPVRGKRVDVVVGADGDRPLTEPLLGAALGGLVAE